MATKSKNKYLSTTALSKELNIEVKQVFKMFLGHGLIERENDQWVLTDKGKENGGVVKKLPSVGEYIAWEESIKQSPFVSNKKEKLLSTTALSKHFGVSKFKMNPVLSELGLIQKSVKGWVVTNLGKLRGGKQFEHEKTGVPYVNWPESILENKRLVETMEEMQVDEKDTKVETVEPKPVEFREKFEAKHRAADGHYVRSRAEMLIDNWLYMSEIVHAYERKLPVEEEVYTDFYLPVGKVYIEYWGMENDPKYVNRKNEKLKVYEKYGFHLIELHDSDIQNLDDVLPKKLLKFGIQAY
ncbi:glycerol kinase [Halobacillus fulvus]|nr:glycerol kinase [Halobacillus fulvus]